MKKILLALSCCAIVGMSCTPEEDTLPVDVSKAKMLMSGSWQLKAYMFTPDIAAEIPVFEDYYTPMAGCEKDDYFIFNNSNVMSKYQGLTKCNIADPDSMVYNYSLTQDENFMQVWADPDDPENSVLMAGDMTYPSVDTFIISSLLPNPLDPDVTSRHTMTFVKQ